MECEQYLILYDNDTVFHTKNAVSFKDCLIQFLDHIGENKPLIRKALNAMDTEKEMVELVNVMVEYEEIENVYKIDRVVYEEVLE